METLHLILNRLREEWYLRDSAGHHISTLNNREDALKYAQEMGYRLKIDTGEKVEWFTPKLSEK